MIHYYVRPEIVDFSCVFTQKEGPLRRSYLEVTHYIEFSQSVLDVRRAILLLYRVVVNMISFLHKFKSRQPSSDPLRYTYAQGSGSVICIEFMYIVISLYHIILRVYRYYAPPLVLLVTPS